MGMGSIAGIIIVFIVIAIPLIIITGAILLGIKIIRGRSPSKDPKDQADETKIIQEIYKGLARMEERVEVLETILIEGENSGKEKQ